MKAAHEMNIIQGYLDSTLYKRCTTCGDDNKLQQTPFSPGNTSRSWLTRLGLFVFLHRRR